MDLLQLPRALQLRTVSLAAVVCLTAGLAACGGEEPAEPDEVLEPTAAAVDTVNVLADQTIVDVLMSDDRFSTFVTAMDSAGLTSVFQEEDPLTVFVPTNEAFGAGSPLLAPDSRDRLRDVLLYHAVQEDLSLEDLRARDTLTTLQGDDLAVAPADTSQAGNQLTVGGALVTDPNVRVRNGKIYVINQLLTPPSATEM